MGLHVSLLGLLASQTFAAPAIGSVGETAPAVQDGILQLPISTVSVEEETIGTSNITKRQVSGDLDNFKYEGRKPIVALGFALEVGTPPQKNIIEPDTGSSKLWIPGLLPGQVVQVRSGTESVFFDKEVSSSAQDLKKETGSTYVSERVVLNRFSDEVSIGGTSLGKLDFGIGNLSHPATQLGPALLIV